MTPAEVSGLVSYIGTATQLGGAVLLALFFALLRTQALRRAYFREWSMAWGWVSLALAGVFSLYQLGWVHAEGGARVIWFVYQLAKLLFVSALLSGALAYSGVARPTAVWRIAAPASVAYAALTVALSSGLSGVVGYQGPVAAVALGGSAWAMFRVPRSRATFGSRVTGAFFALLTGLWSVYAVVFSSSLRTGRAGAFLVQHNSYLDLLLQMLLGYGMVMVLMEDAKRETGDAHAQLAAAHDDLKRLALYCPLTGVMNRRAWSEGIGLDAVRAAFGAAVMLDLDNLKTVNDLHGHAAGDELLRRTADVLRAAIRPSDRLYRWGGDEFLVLLPGARADDAGRRVVEIVERANRECSSHAGVHVSVGAADFAGGEEMEAAISIADSRMYEEKSRRHRLRGIASASASA